MLSQKSIKQPDVGIYKTADTYENIGITQYMTPSEDERYLIPRQYVIGIFREIEGKMLTAVEAITDDKEKREATKSIVRQMIWSVASEIRLLKLEKQE